MNLDKLKELARDSEADEWESEQDLRGFLGADAPFVAAASPYVVLALIEVAEKARALIQYPEVAQTIKSAPLAEALSRLEESK